MVPLCLKMDFSFSSKATYTYDTNCAGVVFAGRPSFHRWTSIFQSPYNAPFVRLYGGHFLAVPAWMGCSSSSTRPPALPLNIFKRWRSFHALYLEAVSSSTMRKPRRPCRCLAQSARAQSPTCLLSDPLKQIWYSTGSRVTFLSHKSHLWVSVVSQSRGLRVT